VVNRFRDQVQCSVCGCLIKLANNGVMRRHSDVRADQSLPREQRVCAASGTRLWAPVPEPTRVVRAVLDAEQQALRDHHEGRCHLSPWSCSHCEQAQVAYGQTCSDCERPARGLVPARDGVPSHLCRQCAEHCATRAYVLSGQP